MTRALTPDRLAWLTAAGLVFAGVSGPWLLEWGAFRTVHLALAPLLALGVLLGWKHPPLPLSVRARWAVLVAALFWLEATAVSRFLGFAINGVDFSVFDWMLASTARGQWAYSPIYEVNHLGVHSTFALLLLAPLHALAPSPWWLLLLGPLLVWLGAFPLLRLLRREAGGAGEPGGFLVLLTLLAWLTSAWLGRLVNEGFRIESPLPVLTVWFLVGWREERRWLTWSAVLLLWCTKEDVTLALAGFAVGAALVERRRWKEALVLGLGSLGFLALYVAVLRPLLAPGAPQWGTFWSEFGATPGAAAVGMLEHPLRALVRVATSGLWLFFGPLLFLPWRSPRAAGALLPTVLLLGTATYDVMHDYRVYYAAPLVPFALWGTLEWLREGPGAPRLRLGVVTVALLLFPLFAGGYARAVKVDGALLRGMAAARDEASRAPRVCAQTVLFPHLGYPAHLVPLFDASCADAPGTVTLVHPTLNAAPHEPEALAAMVSRWRETREVRELEGGLLVVGPPREDRGTAP